MSQTSDDGGGSHALDVLMRKFCCFIVDSTETHCDGEAVVGSAWSAHVALGFPDPTFDPTHQASKFQDRGQKL